MVSATKLYAAERLVDELDPADRVRLLQYLAPRIAEAVLPTPAAPTQQVDESWQRLREVGQRIAAAAAKDPNGPSMTEMVSEMRR
jgi:hypothetical protein